MPFILAASSRVQRDAPDDEDIERERRMAEPDRSFAAFDGPDIVGTSSAFTMPMSVPRRRDRRRLPDQRGGPTHASAPRGQHRADAPAARRRARAGRARLGPVRIRRSGIYGRYGYGLGTLGLVDRDRDGAFGVRPWLRAVRIDAGWSTRQEAVKAILAINEATRLDRPGMVQLDERRLDYVLSVTSTVRRRSGRRSSFVSRGRQTAWTGSSVYKVRQDWPQGYSRSTLDVRDLQATNAPAYADLWRFVLDVDLIERVEAWNRPLDEPLLHLLREPRRLRARMIDNLWVRLVDLDGALRARRYATDGRLVARDRRRVLPVERGPVRARGVGRERQPWRGTLERRRTSRAP